MNKEDIRTIDQQAKDLSHEIQDRQLELVALQQKQITIAEYKAAVDEQLLAFAKTYENGEHKQDNASTYIVGAVDVRAANKIKALCGADVAGFNHAIKAGAVRHIINRHGTAGQADHSMADLTDLSRINYVLQNFDTVELSNEKSTGLNDRDNTPAKIMLFKKRINGTMVLAEAVTNTPRRQLQIISAYIQKVKEKEKCAIRSETNNTSLMEERLVPRAEALGITSETIRSSLTNSISQSKENVNSKNKNKELEKEQGD